MQIISARPDVSYYAPRAIVQVQGLTLAQQVIADILSITVTLEIDKLASFTLEVNNWESDPTKLGFKYSDTALFDVGHTVHIQLGYADQVESIVRGVITSMAPVFPESGPPTIEISASSPTSATAKSPRSSRRETTSPRRLTSRRL